MNINIELVRNTQFTFQTLVDWRFLKNIEKIIFKIKIWQKKIFLDF